MNFISFGEERRPSVMLIPGLGVSYEIFTPLIKLLRERYNIIAVEIDGFTLNKHTSFTTVDDQAGQIIEYIKTKLSGRIECIYGLSLGGKILSRILERGEVIVEHAIMDAAPLLALPRWLINPLRHLQAMNVWSCYHHHRFWRWVFGSHYFDVLLDECKKVYPYGRRRAVLDGYKSVYTSSLESIHSTDIHYWYGTKESFVARPMTKHLLKLHPATHIEVFQKMNHGELLIDHTEEVAKRIVEIVNRPQITTRPARKEDAPTIAQVIAMAIGDEAGLRNYCGDEYISVLSDIARAEGTQYSYQNAIVAEYGGKVVGAVVGYDGARLEELRCGTLAIIKERTGRVPLIVDETEAGEYYLDSVAVLPQFRSLGVGVVLIKAFVEHAFREGAERVGLIVDKENPNAERLYTSLGFKPVGELMFFTHEMRHLQIEKMDYYN